MASSLKTTVGFMFLIIAAIMINTTTSMPSISKKYDALSGLDFIQICLDNCAQCKIMFGNYFQGQACAESCLKFKGKAIPNCEDIGSIAQFVNTYE